MPLLRPSLLLVFTLLLGGCSLFGVEEPELSEPELWEDALEALSDDNYEIAINKLEELESRFPFGRYSAQAQLELIYAYHKTARAEQTRAAADRFIRLHPEHDNVDYAYYLRGLSNFDEDADVVARYVPTDSSQRDPGAARDSFNDFATLLNRYPQSQYAPDARLRMLYLRNQLAAYEVHVARYYITRGAFIAAANRGRYVVENYQQTPSVPDALAIMVRSYTELGLDDLARDAQRVLEQNFPGYSNAREEERSLLNILTFGLLGKNAIDQLPAPTDGSASATSSPAAPEGFASAITTPAAPRLETASDSSQPVSFTAPTPAAPAPTAEATPVTLGTAAPVTTEAAPAALPVVDRPPSAPTEPMAATTAPAATDAATSDTPAGEWEVQLGSFQRQSNAEGLVERLTKAGYSAFLRQQGQWYKVMVGPLPSRESAHSQQQQLQKEFRLSGLIVDR